MLCHFPLVLLFSLLFPTPTILISPSSLRISAAVAITIHAVLGKRKDHPATSSRLPCSSSRMAASWQLSSLPLLDEPAIPLSLVTSDAVVASTPPVASPLSDFGKDTADQTPFDVATIALSPSQPPSIATTSSSATTVTTRPSANHPSLPSSPQGGLSPYYSKALPALPTSATTGTEEVTGRGGLTVRISTTMPPSQTVAAAPSFQAERPTGTPRCIVRIDRDHDNADEATRFECEQFPEEFSGRVRSSLFLSFFPSRLCFLYNLGLTVKDVFRPTTGLTGPTLVVVVF